MHMVHRCSEGEIVATLDEAVATLIWPPFEVIGFVRSPVAARICRRWDRGSALPPVDGLEAEDFLLARSACHDHVRLSRVGTVLSALLP